MQRVRSRSPFRNRKSASELIAETREMEADFLEYQLRKNQQKYQENSRRISNSPNRENGADNGMKLKNEKSISAIRHRLESRSPFRGKMKVSDLIKHSRPGNNSPFESPTSTPSRSVYNKSLNDDDLDNKKGTSNPADSIDENVAIELVLESLVSTRKKSTTLESPVSTRKKSTTKKREPSTNPSSRGRTLTRYPSPEKIPNVTETPKYDKKATMTTTPSTQNTNSIQSLSPVLSQKQSKHTPMETKKPISVRDSSLKSGSGSLSRIGTMATATSNSLTRESTLSVKRIPTTSTTRTKQDTPNSLARELTMSITRIPTTSTVRTKQDTPNSLTRESTLSPKRIATTSTARTKQDMSLAPVDIQKKKSFRDRFMKPGQTKIITTNPMNRNSSESASLNNSFCFSGSNTIHSSTKQHDIVSRKSRDEIDVVSRPSRVKLATKTTLTDGPRGTNADQVLGSNPNPVVKPDMIDLQWQITSQVSGLSAPEELEKRHRSVGDHSIAQVQTALRRVEHELTAKKDRSESRKIVLEALQVLADTLESNDDKDTLIRQLSLLRADQVRVKNSVGEADQLSTKNSFGEEVKSTKRRALYSDIKPTKSNLTTGSHEIEEIFAKNGIDLSTIADETTCDGSTSVDTNSFSNWMDDLDDDVTATGTVRSKANNLLDYLSSFFLDNLDFPCGDNASYHDDSIDDEGDEENEDYSIPKPFCTRRNQLQLATNSTSTETLSKKSVDTNSKSIRVGKYLLKDAINDTEDEAEPKNEDFDGIDSQSMRDIEDSIYICDDRIEAASFVSSKRDLQPKQKRRPSSFLNNDKTPHVTEALRRRVQRILSSEETEISSPTRIICETLSQENNISSTNLPMSSSNSKMSNRSLSKLGRSNSMSRNMARAESLNTRDESVPVITPPRKIGRQRSMSLWNREMRKSTSITRKSSIERRWPSSSNRHPNSHHHQHESRSKVDEKADRMEQHRLYSSPSMDDDMSSIDSVQFHV